MEKRWQKQDAIAHKTDNEHFGKMLKKGMVKLHKVKRFPWQRITAYTEESRARSMLGANSDKDEYGLNDDRADFKTREVQKENENYINPSFIPMVI